MKLSVAALLAAATLLSASAADRPNVMVFLVDDMGVMDTSVPFLTDEKGAPKRYPLNDFYRTPGMERLAKQGIRFNQFYAMSVCSPTRISIMTGQNAARHRATNWINPWTDNAGDQGPKAWNWTGLGTDDVTLRGKGHRCLLPYRSIRRKGLIDGWLGRERWDIRRVVTQANPDKARFWYCW